MSYGDVKDSRPSFSYPEEKLSDERFGSGSSQSSPLIPQAIVFPYVGPPGSGPGLLGSRPGSGVTEFLIALEHHAASLKSALQVVHALKSKNDDGSSVESDSQKEDKKSGVCAEVSSLEEHMPCVFSNGLESSCSKKQPSSILDGSTKPILSKQSSSDDSNSDFTINDYTEDFTYSSVTNGQVVDSCKSDMKKTNVSGSDSYKLTDGLSIGKSVCMDEMDKKHSVKYSADNLKPQRLIFCSRNGADDGPSENIYESATKEDDEESCAVLKKKALRAARNGLHQCRRLMVEGETSPQRKAVEGILLCLTSLCKEEELWNMKEDFLVSLEIPL